MDYVFCLFGLTDSDATMELITLHRSERDAIESFNELWSKYYSGYKILRKKIFWFYKMKIRLLVFINRSADRPCFERIFDFCSDIKFPFEEIVNTQNKNQRYAQNKAYQQSD